MRILFANSIRMFGGAEVWFLAITPALARKGHDVALACRPGTELEARTRASGIRVYPFRFGADVGPLNLLRAVKLLRAYHPDVLCTNQDKELRTFGLASRVSGIGRIVHRRAIDHPLKNNWRYRLTYNVLAWRVVANSFATRDTLLASAPWLAADHLLVIHNGIDPAPYDGSPRRNLRREWGLERGVPIVGFVGQLDERKGISALLQAFEIVAKERDSRLVLVGHGVLAEQIAAFRRSSPVGKLVVSAGFRDDIPDVMKTVDVLVLPSLWEGFGIVLIEAMAAGKPVVATRVSSIPEIVVDGVTGVLVPPNDPVVLATEIVRLLADATLSRRMGEAGRKRVVQEFTLQRMADRYERLFLNAAARG